MKTLVMLSLLSAMSSPAFAAQFKVMKAGEWRSEIVESSMGIAGKMIKPQTLCIDENDVKRDWEAVLKDQFKKSQMDCKLDKLKEESSSISYHINCKGTEASEGKKGSIPKDATYEGTVHMQRESDTAYLLDTDSKMRGIKVSEADLAKIPAEQRKAIAGILAMQTGDIKVKMKQRYSFVKAGCVKAKEPEVKATVIPAPAPEAPAQTPVKK